MRAGPGWTTSRSGWPAARCDCFVTSWTNPRPPLDASKVHDAAAPCLLGRSCLRLRCRRAGRRQQRPAYPSSPARPDRGCPRCDDGGPGVWQVPLAADGPLSPLAVNALGVAVFDQIDALYGLSMADGHQAWSWSADSQDIAGMWQWQGLVIVLTNPQGGWPQLTGLDASTGQAQWTQYIDGYVARSYPTADGGLAMIRLGRHPRGGGPVQRADPLDTPGRVPAQSGPRLSAAHGCGRRRGGVRHERPAHQL